MTETIKHSNESEDVDYICGTCRHENTVVCLEHKRKRRYYLKNNAGKPMKYEKKYCVFWSYKPVGLWSV